METLLAAFTNDEPSTTQYSCSVTGEAFTVSDPEASPKVCCPDPDNHLGIGATQSCIGTTGWIHEIEVGASIPNSLNLSGVPLLSMTATEHEGQLIIESTFDRISARHRVMPLAGLVIITFVLFGIGLFVSDRLQATAKRKRRGLKYRFLVGCEKTLPVGMSLGFFASILVLSVILSDTLIASMSPKVIRISDRQIALEERRLLRTKTAIFAPPQMVAIGQHNRDHKPSVSLTWRDHNWDHHHLAFSVDGEDKAQQTKQMILQTLLPTPRNTP